MNPLLLIDAYKADHRSQYPTGTKLVYSNFTPRKSRVQGNDKMVFFGLQYLILKYLIDDMNHHFFNRARGPVVNEYQLVMDRVFGPGKIKTQHIADLHDLGYLPLEIQALPEGTVVPMQTPVMVFFNTHDNFAWITNYLETLMSNILWKPSTSATTAHLFRLQFDRYAEKTGGNKVLVPFQGHDFSFRGLSLTEDAFMSGAAHLLSFQGTDTIPALPLLDKYYFAQDDIIGGSVPATEHSVMSADDEIATFDRLLFETYPTDIVSVVSDTYDFWKIIGEYLPSRKDRIMARNGTVVIRPDTGTPNLVLCGDPDSDSELERKGLIRCLYETFGGTETEQGYLQLDSHIGAIYGDSIDLNEQQLILSRLEQAGFASTNCVLGIGSYSYQYVTRDTYGIACKATYCEVNDEPRNIFKSPKTGAWKKSHKGLLRVNPDLSVEEEVDWMRQGGELRRVFRDGQLIRVTSLREIRKRLADERASVLSKERDTQAATALV